MDILQILAKESYNTNRIYLYEENENWCAYEQSAYYINRFIVPIRISKQVYDPYPIIISKIDIGKNIIWNKNWEIISCSDSEVTMAYRPNISLEA